MPLQQKKPAIPWVASASVANKIERSDPSPPLKSGEATSAVLYPGLLAQERHSEFFKLHKKIGASVIQKG